MLKNQRGFTLIELVMIIVILGILAAVAVPRYIDLQSEARVSACQGARGGLFSTAAILIGQAPRGPKAVSVVITNTSVSGVIFTAVPATVPDTVDVDLDENNDGASDYDCGADLDLVTPNLAVDG